MNYLNYPIRTCRTMHECGVCSRTIVLGDQYYDGGYGRRAHVRCVHADKRPIFNTCNICGHPLKNDAEFAMGMCLECANA